MSKSTNKLHGLIGDYMRMIDRIKIIQDDSVKKMEVKINRVKSLRKMIVDTANKIQKGAGW